MDIISRNEPLKPLGDLETGDTFTFSDCATLYMRCDIAKRGTSNDVSCVRLSGIDPGEVCYVTPTQPVSRRIFVLTEKP